MVDLINDVLGTDVEPEYEPIHLENYVRDTCADSFKGQRGSRLDPQISLDYGINCVCTPHLAD